MDLLLGCDDALRSVVRRYGISVFAKLDRAAHLGTLEAASVAQEQSRSAFGWLAIHESDLAIYHDVAVAPCPLHASPFVARNVMHYFDGQDFQTFIIVHDDIRRVTRAEYAAVRKPGTQRRPRAQFPMCLFQAEHTLVTSKGSQEFRWI